MSWKRRFGTQIADSNVMKLDQNTRDWIHDRQDEEIVLGSVEEGIVIFTSIGLKFEDPVIWWDDEKVDPFIKES